jgi:hypothetical protein
MSLPYDATLKDLVQSFPRDWLAALGLPAGGPVAAVNVDLSTVSAATDAVFALGEPPESYVTLDFQSSRDASLARRVLVYNVLLHQRFRVPVHSAVVLLRRAAEDSGLDGTVRYEAQPGRGGLDFRFEVVRLWQRPVDELLRGTVGTLPLAPLGALPEGLTPDEALPVVVRRIEERLVGEATPLDAAKLLTAAYVLTGMRVSEDEAKRIFQGGLMLENVLEDSTTYQYILRKGAIRHTRQLLLRQGRAKFGEPDAATVARIEVIDDLDQLDRLGERLVTAATWQELFESS